MVVIEAHMLLEKGLTRLLIVAFQLAWIALFFIITLELRLPVHRNYRGTLWKPVTLRMEFILKWVNVVEVDITFDRSRVID